MIGTMGLKGFQNDRNYGVKWFSERLELSGVKRLSELLVLQGKQVFRMIIRFSE